MTTQVIFSGGRSPFRYRQMDLLTSSNAASSTVTGSYPYDGLLITKAALGGNQKMTLEVTMVNDTAATLLRIGSSGDWNILPLAISAMSSNTGKDTAGTITAAAQIFGMKY